MSDFLFIFSASSVCRRKCSRFFRIIQNWKTMLKSFEKLTAIGFREWGEGDDRPSLVGCALAFLVYIWIMFPFSKFYDSELLNLRNCFVWISNSFLDTFQMRMRLHVVYCFAIFNHSYSYSQHTCTQTHEYVYQTIFKVSLLKRFGGVAVRYLLCRLLLFMNIRCRCRLSLLSFLVRFGNWYLLWLILFYCSQNSMPEIHSINQLEYFMLIVCFGLSLPTRYRINR